MEEQERLVVLLEARIRDFERAMDKAERTASGSYRKMRQDSQTATAGMEADMVRATQRMNQSLSAMSTQIGSFGRTFIKGFAFGAVTAGIAELQGMVRGAVTDIAKMGDEARRSGLSLKDFQQWKYVAEQNRIGLDQMIDGFKELSLRADEFLSTGSGPAAESFKRLGFSAVELRAKLQQPSDLLVEIIDRLHRFDRAAQIRISDELFGGSAGERFVELIDRGSVSLRRQMQEVQQLGGVLDEQYIKRADEIDRRWKSISFTIGTEVKRATLDTIDVLGGVVDLFREIENRQTSTLQKSLLGVYDQIAQAKRDLAEMEGRGTGLLAGILGNTTTTQELQAQKKLIEDLTQEALQLRDVLDRRAGFGEDFIFGLGKSLPQAQGAFGALARSAEDASMRALRAFQRINDGLNGIQNEKTITIRTFYQTDGGGVTVTSHSTGTNGSTSGTGSNGPTLRHINVSDFLASASFAEGGFTGHKPTNTIAGFVHGQEYVFDAETTRRIGVGNLEAIRRGVSGYETGGPVGAVAALAGGRDHLSMIEQNTYDLLEEMRRAVGYFEAMHDLDESMLDALQDLAGRIGLASRGGSLGSSGGYAGGGSSGGGFSGFSSGGGGGRVYSFNDPDSPYFYRNSVYPGGPQYNAVADALLNGNMGALKNLTASQIGNIYTATPTNIAGNYQDINKIIQSIINSGPQLGTYGGGINITADSDFLSGSGMFGSGGARPGALTDWTLNRMTASQEELMAYGPNRQTAANLKKLGFNTGGMIHPGDSQHVEFFRDPRERVIIARPDQFEDRRGGSKEATVNKTVHLTVNMPRSGPVTPQTRQADAEAADRFRRAVNSVLSGE